jgi:hypothetical protein
LGFYLTGKPPLTRVEFSGKLFSPFYVCYSTLSLLIFDIPRVLRLVP